MPPCVSDDHTTFIARLVRFILPLRGGGRETHRAGFFCAPTVFIFYQAVYSKPPNYQVIVLVNCTLILVFLLNVCTVFEHIVEENQNDKTLRPLPLIARACRIKSCKLQTPIRYSPK